jgi:alpha-beta hydrolase superfamily lysophospholipase
MLTWPQSRRFGFGAVLTCAVFWIPGCGGSDDIVTPGPPPEEPPADPGVTPEAGCTDGGLQTGALYRICFPATWNGDLVLYAHGYVAPHEELALPDDQIGGQSASTIVTELGYAFATTSYRSNGLVAVEAVDDLVELVDTIEHRYRPDPERTAIVGFSEGGLVAALAVERHPDRFDGALAACGPIGDFRAQLDYIGDFRVVFDYLFPGVLPGTAVDVPQSLRDRWSTVYVPAIVVSLAANLDAARELLAITHVPAANADLRAVTEAVLGLLWYNVFGTADAQQRLGGQPYDNTERVYSGSSDDAALNAGVDRFQAEPAALAGVERFQTSGNPTVPVVTMHTSGDPIVPFEQLSLYTAKVKAAGQSANLTETPVDRFGHCSFQAPEVLSAFTTLWNQIPDHPATLASTAGRN